MKIFDGILGLAASKKACMSILVLGSATVGMILGKLDGTAYAATMSVVSGIFMYTSHRVEVAALTSGSALPSVPGGEA